MNPVNQKCPLQEGQTEREGLGAGVQFGKRFAMRFIVSSIACVGLLVATAPAGAQSAPAALSAVEASAAEALAGTLVTTAAGFAPGTASTAMESQFALVLARFSGSCGAMISGINMARAKIASAPARQALDNVRGTVARCNRGTGAGPDGDGVAGLPGFNAGGSANYES